MGEFLLLFIILLLLAFLMRADFIVYVIYVMVGVFLFSHFYPRHLVSKLKVSRGHHLRAFLGESKRVEIHISNGSRLPIPWLEARESIAPELPAMSKPDRVLRFKGKETRTLTYQIKGLKRGYYRIGPLRVSAGDLFGFSESSIIFEPSYLTIYPRIINLPRLNLSSRIPFGSLRSTQRLFEDPTRPIGVRNFVRGDSLRHINWKVSAHSERLFVKTYEPAISLESMLLLNLNRSEYSGRFPLDTAEWSITVAASLATYLTGQRQAVGFATNGVDPVAHIDPLPLEFDEKSGRLEISGPNRTNEVRSDPISSIDRLAIFPPRSGRGHLMTMLEQMARIELNQSTSFYRWIITATHQLPWGVTVIVITPEADEPAYHSLHHLRHSGYNPIVIITEPYLDFRQHRKLAAGYNLPIFHIFDEKGFSKLYGMNDRPQSGKFPVLRS